MREAVSGGSHLGERGRSVVRRELRGLREVIAGVISEGIDEGAFAAVDPEFAARIVLGAVRMASDADGTEAAGSVADLLLDGLGQQCPPGHRP
ncbi:MAG: hypothetical protein AB7O95_20735 [Geminicoccaceae bacterium]